MGNSGGETRSIDSADVRSLSGDPRPFDRYGCDRLDDAERDGSAVANGRVGIDARRVQSASDWKRAGCETDSGVRFRYPSR